MNVIINAILFTVFMILLIMTLSISIALSKTENARKLNFFAVRSYILEYLKIPYDSSSTYYYFMSWGFIQNHLRKPFIEKYGKDLKVFHHNDSFGNKDTYLFKLHLIPKTLKGWWYVLFHYEELENEFEKTILDELRKFSGNPLSL